MEKASDIIDIPAARRDEAAEVLTEAFLADPLAKHLFRDSPAPYQDCLRELFRFSCSVRHELDWPLKGALLDGRLMGVAGFSLPDDKEWPPTLQAIFHNLKEFIGPQASARLEEYSRLADEPRPVERHYFLGVMGVHPQAQGKGLARALLETLHSLSEADPTSIGVALDTENARNVPFYEHFGYRVIARPQADGVSIWCMFRPNCAESAS